MNYLAKSTVSSCFFLPSSGHRINYPDDWSSREHCGHWWRPMLEQGVVQQLNESMKRLYPPDSPKTRKSRKGDPGCICACL